MPIKCPVAPLEFTFLADDYFRKRGIRDKVNITYVTSLSGAFTKPVASEKLGHLLQDKNINIVADFYVEKVVPEENKLVCYDGREVNYDLLVTVPVNVGAPIVRNADFCNELGFVEVNHHSLQSTKYQNVFAVGDAANLPTSKAGSVAHFEVETLEENIQRLLNNEPLLETFDGHSNCFVETGGGKALLLDFNYEVQPLEGKFPFAVIGPMKLLNPSRLNHIGKLAFRYIYWYMLLPGRKIPFIPAQMSTNGKKLIKE
jgi:sulfide:quinone oxidoreductase